MLWVNDGHNGIRAYWNESHRAEKRSLTDCYIELCVRKPIKSVILTNLLHTLWPDFRKPWCIPASADELPLFFKEHNHENKNGKIRTTGSETQMRHVEGNGD